MKMLGIMGAAFAALPLVAADVIAPSFGVVEGVFLLIPLVMVVAIIVGAIVLIKYIIMKNKK